MLQNLLKTIFDCTPSTPHTTRRVGREHFIPVRPSELIDTLLADENISAVDRSRLQTLFRHFQSILHHETQLRLTTLSRLYECVNPDRDTEDVYSDRQRRELANQDLFHSFVELLERANFTPLSEQDLHKAIGTASTLGVRLHVDLDSFAELAVFARGQMVATHAKKSWKRLFRSEDVDIPMYQRLVVLFRLQSQSDEVEPVEAVHLRLFKNVPQQDVDMTLPGGTVKLSMFERGKIMLPTLSGVALAAIKTVKVLAIAGVYGLIALLGLICGAIGSGMKTVNGYVKTRNQYELNLARNLYYQNLDCNLGVLLRIAAEAEQQELREACLGYFTLWRQEDGSTSEQLDELVEDMLDDIGVVVDFEVEDALAKLVSMGVAASINDRWHVEPLRSAIQTATTKKLRYSLTH